MFHAVTNWSIFPRRRAFGMAILWLNAIDRLGTEGGDDLRMVFGNTFQISLEEISAFDERYFSVFMKSMLIN